MPAAARSAAHTALAVAAVVAVAVLAALSPIGPVGSGGAEVERPALERERDGSALLVASLGVRRPQADNDVSPPLALPPVVAGLAVAVVAWARGGPAGPRPPLLLRAGCWATRAPPLLRTP